MKTLLKNLWSDESGAETLDYALVLGLLVLVALAVMSALGVKVLQKWSSIYDVL